MAEKKHDDSMNNTEDDTEEIVTLSEVISRMDEDDAIIMGGTDAEGTCTFTKGYMKRQCIYACHTCMDGSQELAGICYDCMESCHEGHDLLELYTKRDFRCDCGNAKFKDFRCKLWEEKDDYNEQNKYNDNFKGQYCICKKPYPDPEFTDDMVQCCVCEDWFHMNHLRPENTPPLSSNDFEELTCAACMEKHTFLRVYQRSFAFLSKDELACHVESASYAELQISGDVGNPPIKRTRMADHYHCRYEVFQGILEKKALDQDPHKAAFWPDNWRAEICSCSTCKNLYKEQKVSFLLDPGDPVHVYTEKGRQKVIAKETAAVKEFNQFTRQLPHQVAIDMASRIGSFQDDLKTFLESCQANDRTITAEDVQKFFQERKRGHRNE